MYEMSARTSRVIDRLLAMERELHHLKGFDGWVIGSCSFTLSPAVNSSMAPEPKEQLAFLHKNENRALIQIRICEASTNGRTPEASANRADQMRVLLLHPTAPIFVKNDAEPERVISNKSGLCFPTEEIDRYLNQVSDYNSIHRGPDAIVPGFLMVNRLLEIFLEEEKSFELIQANVKFPTPLKVGESVFLFQTSDYAGKIRFLLRNRAGQIILNMELL